MSVNQQYYLQLIHLQLTTTIMKLKTHKATIKRVKVSGSGKLLRVKAAKSHLLSHKSERTTISLEISRADIRKVKKLAPYLK